MRIVFRCDPALEPYLPRPVPAREALPRWLTEMPRQAPSDAHGMEVRTVKHCSPFIDAMSHGFIMPLPCDVRVEDGALAWDWDIPAPAARSHPRSPISFHASAQVEGTPLRAQGQVIVKFNSFWTIELEPGWSLFATHPLNRPDLPFTTLSGVVDADRFHDVGILFPAVWRDRGFSGLLPRGTPVAQCFPVPRDAPELVFEALDQAGVKGYDAAAQALFGGPGVYRKQFRAPRLRPGSERGPEPGEIEPQPPDRGGDDRLGDPPE
jgi:hypothetical protein